MLFRPQLRHVERLLLHIACPLAPRQVRRRPDAACHLEGHWTLDSGVSSANGCSAWTHGSAKKRALAPPISLASVLPPSRPLLFLASPFPRPSCLRPLPSCIPPSYPDPLSFPALPPHCCASLQEHDRRCGDEILVLICYEWRCACCDADECALVQISYCATSAGKLDQVYELLWGSRF